MIKGFVFDVDNSIAFLSDVHKDALNKALISLCYQPISEKDHYEKFNGLSTKKKLTLLGFDPMDIQLINEIKQSFTIKEIERLVKPEKNITETFEYLKILNIKIAIASNAVRNSVNAVLNYMDLMRFVDFSLSNEDVGGKIKPNSEIYFEATRLLELEPEEICVVEDHPFGHCAALGAGLHLWKVNNPNDVTKENAADQINFFNGVC